MKTTRHPHHINQDVVRDFGNVHVECDIDDSDPSLEPNLRASIVANATELKGPEERRALQDKLGLGYEDVRNVHVSVQMPMMPPVADDFHGSDNSLRVPTCFNEELGTCGTSFPTLLCAAIHRMQESQHRGLQNHPLELEATDIHS